MTVATLVKERPILFNAEMVQAVLSGRKTQTRRVVKPQPTKFPPEVVGAKWFDEGDFQEPGFYALDSNYKKHGKFLGSWRKDCPYGLPGDRLWVRETWCHTGEGVWKVSDIYNPLIGSGKFIYKADEECPSTLWFPSIHMPRIACRILLEITAVRVERVQDISADDSLAEGVSKTKFWTPDETNNWPFEEKMWDDFEFWTKYPQIAFQRLWDSINASRGNGWDVNPWVWVVEFKVVELKK